MIKNIAFYNHYHNGDVFATKAYVKEITDAFPDLKFFYMHRNSNKLLADLPIEIFNINYFPSLYDRTKIIVGEVDNTIYINTWIRNILESGTGVNWETYHLMFKEFYSFLNEYFGSNLILKDKNFYIPEIDFSFFDIPNDFVCDYENTIIFSNDGVVLSGQSNLLSTDNIVLSLLDAFPNRKIILTHRTPIINDNILYTDDIIKTFGGDLNEISWIAEKCKYIIGRNSGPFCYMHTKNILNDKTKKIIAVGNTKRDCFLYNMQVDSDYRILIDENEEELIKSIIKIFGE